MQNVPSFILTQCSRTRLFIHRGILLLSLGLFGLGMTACSGSDPANMNPSVIKGWAIGDPQASETLYILATYDGIEWFIQHEFTAAMVTDVFALNSKTAWVTGQDGRGSSMLLRTTDGGRTWKNMLETHRGSTIIQSVNFGDKVHGFAVGEEGLIYETTNGGANWHSTNYRHTTPEDQLMRVHSYKNQALTAGKYPENHDYNLYRTDYVGWKQVAFSLENLPKSRVTDIFFLDADRAFVSTGSGWVLHSNDSGISWNYYGEQASPFLGLLSLYAVDETTIFTGTVNTELLYTRDGGNTWNSFEIENDDPDNPPAAIDIIKISAIDDKNIWFCGYNVTGNDGGIYYKTHDMAQFRRAVLPKPMGIFGISMVGSRK